MKRALCVGINQYRTPGSDLNGCVNDVLNLSDILKNKFGFDKIYSLTNMSASTKNIKKNLERLVEGSESGDTLVFQFSGHGSTVRDTNRDEIDGVDEILCPTDLDWCKNMITDDYIYKTFSKVKKGVKLVFLSDSCHSGSMLKSIPNDVPAIKEYNVPRFMVPPSYVAEEIFKARSDIYDNDTQMTLITNGNKKKETFENVNGILLSGCTNAQTSADAYINRQYQGAFTSTLISILKQYNYDVTYSKLISEVNKKLDKMGYSQNPQLECKNELKDGKFLA